MISIKDKNQRNYLAKVVAIPQPRKHSNADRLQVVTIDFQQVITGLDAKEGDLYVYFPLESKINKDFLSVTNSFANKDLNQDKEVKGYFTDSGRVKATRLRGEKSMGYLVPCKTVSDFIGCDLSKHVGEEFDTFGTDKVLCEKYLIKTKRTNSRIKEGKKPLISRLVDGQFKLHVSTDNLRKNMSQVKPQDIISITYKLHGTSAVFGNVLTKKKLGLGSRFAKWIGLPIQTTKNDVVYSSRKVVKNEAETNGKESFYSEDIWGIVKKEIEHLIPKGWTLYGEIVGYLPSGQMIQKDFDYGCAEGEHDFYVYRITTTNEDGFTIELNNAQINSFCELTGLKTPYTFYVGEAQGMFKDLIDYSREDWRTFYVEELESTYNEKDCYMCNNKVPEEGIILRQENNLTNFEAYKLKSFRFLEKETKQLDKGIVSIEDEN